LGKISTSLKIIRKILRNPEILGGILDEEEIWTRRGFERGLPTVDRLDLSPDFNIDVNPHSFLYGTSLIDIALLKVLAKRYEKCRYFEIGTWRGESVVNVAEVAGECITVDLPVDELLERGIPRQYIESMGFFSASHPRIKHIHQNSKSLDIPSLGKFDLIFIDGDHTCEGVRNDTEVAFQLLRNPKSIIVWHDYGNGPEATCWSLLAGIIDGSPTSELSKIYHVSNTMCAAYLPDTYTTSFPPLYQKPNKIFKVRIDAERIKGRSEDGAMSSYE
jgi:hypothetical protein